jgi:hypothetical protein
MPSVMRRRKCEGYHVPLTQIVMFLLLLVSAEEEEEGEEEEKPDCVTP